jgi:hypothetical protein
MHYGLIRDYYYGKYYKAKKYYNDFINEFVEPDENRLMILIDDEDGKKQYITRNFVNRIQQLVDKNPKRKPNIKGWFPGIINIADINENKNKNK